MLKVIWDRLYWQQEGLGLLQKTSMAGGIKSKGVTGIGSVRGQGTDCSRQLASIIAFSQMLSTPLLFAKNVFYLIEQGFSTCLHTRSTSECFPLKV